MRIATWNVNSIRVRMEFLTEFLRLNDIDVILLQELKCVTEAFPREYFEDLGYNSLVFGQKTYNGVAILSRYNLECLNIGSDIFIGDPQARYIEALTNGFVVASVYVPNGQDIEVPAYEYKLKFLSILRDHLEKTSVDDKFIIGGDFNIARSDIDVYNPKAWKGKVCCTDKERSLFEGILDVGLKDSIREISGDNSNVYTWWDYRRSGFSQNRGLRLDYLLTNKNVVFERGYVDLEMRSRERPSDHAAVIMDVS